jgi:hypothetical protein
MRTIKTHVRQCNHGEHKGMFYVTADWSGWYSQRGDFNGVTQTLHKDGTWHTFPQHEMTGEWSGMFDTKEEAETLLARVGPPTTDAPRVSLKCKDCNHIYGPAERHECPTEEYIRERDALIAAALDEQEREDNARIEAGLDPLRY